MARKSNFSYNDIRDLNEDWALDDRNGLKYSGESVQAFIKSQLRGKVGVFYYDADNNRYMVFADEESRDLYLSDPQQYASLLLGVFDAPFEYSAQISVVQSYISLLNGEKNQYIDFTFDIVNKQGASVGDDVNVTYTFSNGGVKKTVNAQYAAGTSVHFLVDDYISVGQNTVTIAIAGVNTLAATTQMVTFYVVDLQLTSNFDFAVGVSPTGVLAVPFTVSGGGVKKVEMFIDGTLTATASGISDATASRVLSVNVPQTAGLGTGRHTLQLRASVDSGGTTFYSRTLYYEFVVTGGTDSCLLIAATLGIGEIATSSRPTLTAMQYEAMSLQWAFYTPNGATTAVTFDTVIDGSTTFSAESGETYTWEYEPSESGTVTVAVSGGTDSETITLDVADSELGLHEKTDSLVLKLSAAGRSNSETARDEWRYGGRNYAAFSGFAWNGQSGWVDGACLVKKGTSLTLDIKPFDKLTASVLRNRGVTVEIDFSTANVDDNDAVVASCADASGVGLTITATGATMKSQLNKEVSTKFKPLDRQRLSFTFHRSSNTVEEYGLMTIAWNGQLDRSVDVTAADSMNVGSQLTFAPTAADVKIYNIYVYATDLTVDETFGNAAVNATNKKKMATDNDVLDERGGISYEKVRLKMPTFLFTGDMNVILNAKSKNDNTRMDVDYHNPYDMTKDFRMTTAYVRPQGTSSLGYPIKNIRLYTKKDANTILYDYLGNVVADRLYAFRDGAQRAKCWTLKADYAESSMSHNTGTARLWNEMMKKMRIGNQYVCRTRAMQAAIDAGYDKDVRIAIDGFPCCVFYRETEDSPIIFMGQFNFNNDKSTESVFGFTDVPGFDNSETECWELLDNANPLCLMTTVENFDAGWSAAFEGRYPDGSENVTRLKGLASWLVGVKNSPTRFATEKWEHLDVYKVAAYYIYLIRHGAVDQPVKNSMLTTEGKWGYRPVTSGGSTSIQLVEATNALWYFQWYDNDTSHGINNDSRLIYGPYINRQSPDPNTEGGYAYAGHEATLWNLLEADTEFMSIVREVDSALYDVGYNYAKCIDVYDNELSAQWPSRIYNASQKYKYIDQYRKGSNLLYMLQGSRQSHRHWWLKTRFDLYDSLWVSGAYRNSVIQFKVNELSGFEGEFTITAGDHLYYGYAINNNVREVTASMLTHGDTYTFHPGPLAIGDPVNVFGASHVERLDLSAYTALLATIQLTGVYDSESGSRLKSLILGNGTAVNNSFSAFDVSRAPSIEELDIRGFKAITNITGLDSLTELHILRAENSGLTIFEPADGAVLTDVRLPETVQVLTLRGCAASCLSFTPSDTLLSLTLDSVTGLDSRAMLTAWMTSISDFGRKELHLRGIEWTGVDGGWLADLAEKGWGTLELRGHVSLNSGVDETTLARLETIFGENCFSPSAPLYIEVEPGLYIVAPTSIVEGDVVTLNARVMPAPEVEGTITWQIMGTPREGTTLNGNVLTTTENGEATGEVRVLATYTPAVGGQSMTALRIITIQAASYPPDYNITLSQSKVSDTEYDFAVSITGSYTGHLDMGWAVTGTLANYATITPSSDGLSAKLVIGSLPQGVAYISGTVKCTVKRHNTETAITTKTSSNIIYKTSDVAFTRVENAPIMTIMYNNGLAENEDYMLKSECAAVTNEDLTPSGVTYSIFYTNRTTISSFDEFQYFTGITALPDNCFNNCSSMTHITLPQSLVSIGAYAFYCCQQIQEIEIPASVTSLGNYMFAGDNFTINRLRRVVIHGNYLSEIPERCFGICEMLQEFVFNGSAGKIGKHAFVRCKSLTSIKIPNGCTEIGESAFYSCSGLTQIIWNATLQTIGQQAFNDCSSLTTLGTLPSSLRRINSYAFTGTSIVDITLPEGFERFALNLGTLPLLESIHLPSTFIGFVYGGCVLYDSAPNLKTIEVAAGNTTYDSRNNCNALIATNGSVLSRACKTTVVPNDILRFDSYAFNSVKGEFSIIVPETCSSIGSSAFVDSDLTGITFHTSKTITVYVSAFQRCSKLKNIVVPSNVSLYGASIFSRSGLLTVEIKDGVSISSASNLFAYCESLTTAIVGKYTGSLGQGTFQNCTSLVNVTLRNTEITASMFYGCTSLQTITIPTTVTSIADSAFAGCTSLTSVIFESSTPPSLLNANAIPTTATLYVPAGSKATYEAATNYGSFTIVERTA